MVIKHGTVDYSIIHLIPKWRRPRIVWVELHKNEASRATEQKRFLEATQSEFQPSLPFAPLGVKGRDG